MLCFGDFHFHARSSSLMLPPSFSIPFGCSTEDANAKDTIGWKPKTICIELLKMQLHQIMLYHCIVHRHTILRNPYMRCATANVCSRQFHVYYIQWPPLFCDIISILKSVKEQVSFSLKFN